MAFEGRPVYDIDFVFRDNNSKTSTVGAYVNASILYTDVLTGVQEIATRLQNASDAALVRYSISQSFRNTTPPVPPKTSEVERKLRIPLHTAEMENATAIEVPSPKFELEIDGTDVVDPANAIVVALLAALRNEGGILDTAQLTDNRGEDVTGTGRPFFTHRHRKPA